MPEPSANPLRRLIGSWEFEASSEGRFLGHGSTTFSWLEDGKFVLQRAADEPSDATPPEWTDNSPMPVTAVIGFDDTVDEQAMLYADGRGVYRIYRMQLTDAAWRVWRDAPGFNQRFIGTIEDDGNTISGRWEASEDGQQWIPDFDLTYRRRL
jgi:hypothetical protein